MTIQDLGNLGDFVGGVAVIATLLYLAVQIRANTVAVKAESLRSTKAHATAVNLTIVQDKSIASLYRKGLASFQSLDPDEQIQFTFLFAEQLSIGDEGYTAMRTGRDDGEAFGRWLTGSKHLLKTPGGTAYWQTFGEKGVSGPFRSFINSEVYGPESASQNPGVVV